MGGDHALCLAVEPFQSMGIIGQFRPQELERNDVGEPFAMPDDVAF
jgi:hypothetical protein